MAKKAQTFSTAADNQTQVGIKVFQGEREMAADNKLLGQFDLVGLPPAPRGVPQIEVSFDIDANGVVNVGAVDKSTGKKQSVTVRSSGGLSDADTKKKDGVQVKNDAETLCYQVEKQLSELKDKMSTADADELKLKLAGVRELLTGESIEDADLVKEKMKDMQDLSWKVTQQAYQSSSDESTEENKFEESKDDKKE